MKVLEQDLCLSECVWKFPCLYGKMITECHKRDVTANGWEGVAKIGKSRKP